MRKFASIAALAAVLSAAAQAAETVTIAGSDILGDKIKAPLAAALKKQGISANLEMKGSFAAADALKNAKADVAIIAVPRGEKKPEGLVLFPFAYHIASVAVNIANPIEEISTSQLYKIYSASASPRVDAWQSLEVGNASLKNIMPITTSFSDSLVVELFSRPSMRFRCCAPTTPR